MLFPIKIKKTLFTFTGKQRIQYKIQIQLNEIFIHYYG